jgi:hypothetical protein
MTDYASTVKDVSRAVANLDTARESDATDAANRVASNLAYQFARHNPLGGRKNVTTRDVRAALMSHGAHPITVDRYARKIANTIRNDFSDGWAYHKGSHA